MKTFNTLNHVLLFMADLAGIGGAERLLWEEERFFAEKGVETTVVTFSLRDRALFDYKPQRLTVIKAGPSRISRILSLRRVLKQTNPDLVIAQSYWDCMYLYLATMFTSIPFIAHIHGTFFWFHKDKMKYALIFRSVFSEIRKSVTGHQEFIPLKAGCGPVKRMAIEFLGILNYLAVRKARKLIVLTDQLKWEVEKLYGKDAVVARGCLSKHLLTYQPKENIKQKLGLEGKKVIFSVGRLDPRKRIDVLIEAFARIASKHENIYLVIGGTGEAEEQLRKLVDKLGIVERVKFVGFIPDSELFDYYAACDVFAFPSWTTSGITPYEALALGKKVVWTTEADEPITHDEHVFLADPTVEHFAQGLENAFNTVVQRKVNLTNYTWYKYFSVVYSVAMKAIERDDS